METIFAYSCLGLELNPWARRETVCILPFKNRSKYKNLMLVLHYRAYDFVSVFGSSSLGALVLCDSRTWLFPPLILLSVFGSCSLGALVLCDSRTWLSPPLVFVTSFRIMQPWCSGAVWLQDLTVSAVGFVSVCGSCSLGALVLCDSRTWLSPPLIFVSVFGSCSLGALVLCDSRTWLFPPLVFVTSLRIMQPWCSGAVWLQHLTVAAVGFCISFRIMQPWCSGAVWLQDLTVLPLIFVISFQIMQPWCSGAVWLQDLTVSAVGGPWQQHCFCVFMLLGLVAPTASRLPHVCPTLPSTLEDVFCPGLLLPLFFFLSPHHLWTMIRHIFFKARKDEMTPEFVCLEDVLPNN